jgi:hypothetical protein
MATTARTAGARRVYIEASEDGTTKLMRCT